jgi:pimeloyl-ACP methyl ester carboxylesterase
MPIATVKGRKVHMQTLGKEGPRVVMIHGMLIGSIASWYFSVAPPLAVKHRLLMYDLRSHGRSEFASEGFGFHAMARDLRDIALDWAGGEPVSVVGHSYGGGIALRFALDHPELAHKAVVIEATLPVITDEGIQKLTRETAESLIAMLPPWQRMAFETGGRRSKKIVEQFEALAQKTSMLSELMAEPDIPDAELARCKRPVLLCYGTQTVDIMRATCNRLAAVLPEAKVEMLDSGHLLPLEAPRRLADAIGRFLDE